MIYKIRYIIIYIGGKCKKLLKKTGKNRMKSESGTPGNDPVCVRAKKTAKKLEEISQKGLTRERRCDRINELSRRGNHHRQRIAH